MNKINSLWPKPGLSAQMKVFELIESYPSLLSIFMRLDIKLPFGDISVEDMCRRDGYTVELFMLLCNMHLSAVYRPTSEELHPDMLKDIVGYLRASHRYYATYMLPHVANHLERVLEHCDALSERLLRGFYADYMSFLTEHFEDEERNIFALTDTPEAVPFEDFSMLEAPHGDIDDRTNDIASLVFKSLPESVPTSLRCAMLDHIYMLRDDLRRHSDLEMYVLRPLVAKCKTSKR